MDISTSILDTCFKKLGTSNSCFKKWGWLLRLLNHDFIAVASTHQPLSAETILTTLHTTHTDTHTVN